jgi:iron complex transport system substrate-binding protein
VKFLKLILTISALSLSLIGCKSKLYLENQDSINISKNEDINKKRVVALSSISADIVNKVSPDQLVAIPGSSLFKNKKEFANLPIISMGRTPPNLEKIVSLKPDLVIGVKGFHGKIIDKLNKINIKTISYDLRNWKDLEGLISSISRELNLSDQKVVENIIDNDLNHCGVIKSNKNSNLIVLASTKPILSPNSNSWAGELLNRFDINSLTKDIDSKSQFKGYINLSPEWLLKQDPDNLILIETRTGQFKEFGINKPFSNLTAVKNNKVYRFNYYGLINPGSLNSINNACKELKNII